MFRNALTERYLDQVAPNVVAGGLPALVKDDPDLQATSYLGRCLTRPVFLDRRERAVLEDDLGNLFSALTSLPRRLFGGDLGAFARATGMTEAQITAVLRTQSQQPTRLARADIYHDGAAFRLMELNVGSALGGFDNAMLNRVVLAHPAMAAFIKESDLSYVDTLGELASMLREEAGVVDAGAVGAGALQAEWEGERPLIAVVDWPASFVKLEARLRRSAEALAPLGVEAVPCHLGQLEFHDGRVWIEDRPADLIYRLFMIEDLLDPSAPELVDPVLRAAERGEVRIFAPMDVELYGSKAALAMLSDEANRHLLDPAELASVDRLLPWTRMVRDGSVTFEGERVDLREFTRDQREDMVLKPTLLHGGLGVVMGWEVDQDEWAKRLSAAFDESYVVQRRIRAVPELFPGPDGPEPWLLRWGVFLSSHGYGGAMVGGTKDLTGAALAFGGNSTCSCCFHETG